MHIPVFIIIVILNGSYYFSVIKDKDKFNIRDKEINHRIAVLEVDLPNTANCYVTKTIKKEVEHRINCAKHSFAQHCKFL